MLVRTSDIKFHVRGLGSHGEDIRFEMKSDRISGTKFGVLSGAPNFPGFEFITTKDCIDIASLYLQDSPEHVCNALTAEAYKHWMTNEERTDDITVICIFIEGNKKGATAEDIKLMVNDDVKVDADHAAAAPSKKTRRGSLKKKEPEPVEPETV